MLKELKVNRKNIMTEQDEIDFSNATKCYLCGEEITENDKKEE